MPQTVDNPNRSKGKTQLLLSDLTFVPSWESQGEVWTSRKTEDFTMQELREADLLVINGDLRRLQKTVVLGGLIASCRKPLVGVDVVLRKPKGKAQELILRTLLDRIDFFVHYFRDLSGYEKYWGITAARSSFVPFKPNLRYRYEPRQQTGEYVLCFGESMRDYANFFAAMEGLSIKGAITERAAKQAAENSLTLPQNVGVLKDDFSQDALIRALEGARVVALPVLPDNICASGLSTYLNSMLLGKPVILTEGPGVSDILTDQAMIIPPKDPEKLRSAILQLWSDQRQREELGSRGRAYAESLGGEPELHQRILDATMRWFYSAKLRSKAQQVR